MWFFDRIDKKLDNVLAQLKILTSKEAIMSVELDALIAQVKANTDAEQSAGIVLKNIHDQLVAAGTDPTKLKALTDTLATSQATLAAAIAANT